MKRYSIIKNEVLAFMKEGTEQECLEWLEYHEFQGTFGHKDIFEKQPVLISEGVYEMELVQIGVDENDEPIYEERIKLIDVLVTPQNYSVVIEDISTEFETQETLLRKMQKGRQAREACLAVLDLVGGDNLEVERTLEQKIQMKQLYANAKDALNDYQPGYAKFFIQQLQPDGILLTEELKNLCLEILKDWPIPV